MKKVLLGLILLMSASVASAQIAQLGWTNITRIHTYKTHGGTLYQTNSMTANGCPSGGWYILPKTHPYYEKNMELLLLARTLNRTVNVTLEGCFEQYPMIRDVMF